MIDSKRHGYTWTEESFKVTVCKRGNLVLNLEFHRKPVQRSRPMGMSQPYRAVSFSQIYCVLLLRAIGPALSMDYALTAVLCVLVVVMSHCLHRKL